MITSPNNDNRDAIVTEATALKIGRALLEEYFPDYFTNEEILIEAKEENGIWKVFDSAECNGITDNGILWVSGGIEYFVAFRKDNGRVIMIGND